MKNIEVVPQLSGFSSYKTGHSIQEIKEKYGLSQVFKMASNENPLGVSLRVKELLCRNADFVFRYPRSGNPDLCEEISCFFGVNASSIVPGNGSDEIIDLLIRILAVPGKHNICAFKPCFNIYETQSRLAGVDFRQAELGPDLEFDFEKLLALTDENTRIVFITNPDNPSGYSVPAEYIAELAGKIPDRAVLAVDEAYVDFADDLDGVSVVNRLDELPNVAVLRTFSKMFGLAGLRLGFGVMHEKLAACLRRVRLPFSVNLLAEQAGIAALRDADFYDITRKTVLLGREYLAKNLHGLGCEVRESQANFLMFTPPVAAEFVFESLLQSGIIIRPLKSYGFRDSLRVSIGNERENRKFISELARIIDGH
ncbi:MAG: histidinol-phosphate transaminase [Thermodesulfobacteriota bacterium]